VIGWAGIIPLTTITAAHLLSRSLYASQGAPHHGYQIVGLVFVAQTLVAWTLLFLRGWRWIVRKSPPRNWPDALKFGNWSLTWRYIAATIAAAYFITAVTKWDESDGKWISNAHYFSNQIVKTHRQNYYNDLNPEYLQGVPPAPLDAPDPENDRYRHPVPAPAQWMIMHPVISRIFFTLGFAMEALAFLLLLNRGLSALFGVAIIGFHMLVMWLMHLTFPMNIETVLVASINLPGWLILLTRRHWNRQREDDGAAPGMTPVVAT
jgi:hypothetical protein